MDYDNPLIMNTFLFQKSKNHKIMNVTTTSGPPFLDLRNLCLRRPQINGGNVFNSPFSLRGHPASAAYGPKSLAESSKPPSTVGEAKMGTTRRCVVGKVGFPYNTKKEDVGNFGEAMGKKRTDMV